MIYVVLESHKLAPYGTEGRLFTTNVSATSKSRDTKTRPKIKNPDRPNLDIVL